MTKDHKRIAILYLITVTVMFFIGGLAITIVRLNLMTPEGGLVSADTYNRLFTMHGVIMVFFFLVPVVPTVLGNFCLPLMIGAKDLAFPRINLLSWYLFIDRRRPGRCTPCSPAASIPAGRFTRPTARSRRTTTSCPTLIGIVIAGFSSIFTGLNFIVTIHRLRAPGLTWWRLPIFVWTIYATSFIFLLAVPVLAMALILVIVERLLQHRHLRSGPGRRSAAVSAPVLVLLAPGRLHHDPAGHGHRQRGHPLLRPQEPVRLHVRRLVELRHRRARLSGLGASHVRGRHLDVRGA